MTPATTLRKDVGKFHHLESIFHYFIAAPLDANVILFQYGFNNCPTAWNGRTNHKLTPRTGEHAIDEASPKWKEGHHENAEETQAEQALYVKLVTVTS